MPRYAAPLAEMKFVLRHLAGLPGVCALPAYAEVTEDTAHAVLDEAARFAGNVLSPLNRTGDREGAHWAAGQVTAPAGFAEAYRAFAAAGWGGISAPSEYGGQRLPRLLAFAVAEMWNSANLSFALAPMLSAGVVHALTRHGSVAQQRLFLPPLVAGRWTGTMNLTEPQAGSDLSALATLATPEADHYRLRGTKVYITWGEHDLAENIIHLVLARTPDAPAGVRGISLFIVPKMIVQPDGTLGGPNDIECVSIERKAGIHASPTCVLNYGGQAGAVAYLVGERHRGLEYMFSMMNQARLEVGLEGVALAESAFQVAATYAATRIQGRAAGSASSERVPIVRHPDVRRMLLSMKSRTECMRALAYYVAGLADRADEHPDAAIRQQAQARADLLTPVVKGWCTEQAVDIAGTGMQVHGGAGYIEEAGAAQCWRDARITPIYEGTTGIQANDLIGRKLVEGEGAVAFDFIAEMRSELGVISAAHEPLRAATRTAADSCELLERATRSLRAASPANAAAVAVPYLELLGTVAGGWMSLKAAAAAPQLQPADHAFAAAKQATARFYATHILTRCAGLAAQVEHGAEAVVDYRDEWL